MVIPFHQRWSGIRRLAASAVLMLGLSSCATFAEVESRDRAQLPAESAQPDAAVPAILPEPQSEPAAPPVEPAADPKAVEPRTPLKDVLLEALGLPDKGKHRYVVKSGDSLAVIADRHHVTLAMLKWANRLETDRIHPGQKLAIPAAALRIEVDKSENKLRLFNDRKLVRAYPVATGNQGVTPTGSYTVANRLIQPTWYWQGYAVPAGDPDYPLGTRWLGLSKRGYGIHGTNEPDSIGKQISHGCIRMHNEDVEELFDVVAVGTAVAIVE